MKNFKIHFLNTIWSDSILLEHNGHYGLVDCASKFYYPMIVDYLKGLNITELDFVILTHFHSDHYGNVAAVLNDYKVKKLYIKEYTAHEHYDGSGHVSTEEYLAGEMAKYHEIIDAAIKNHTKIVYMNKLDELTINFNGTKLEVYNTHNVLEEAYQDQNSPNYHKGTYSENANSTPIYLSYNGHNAYLGADTTNSIVPDLCVTRKAHNVLDEIYNKHHINHIDVYKSCHHGGSDTNAPDFLAAMRPDYAVITNTDRWLDNWKTRDNMRQANPNIKILQTDYQKYVFDFSKGKLEYKKIPDTSLFITLGKN